MTRLKTVKWKNRVLENNQTHKKTNFKSWKLKWRATLQMKTQLSSAATANNLVISKETVLMSANASTASFAARTLTTHSSALRNSALSAIKWAIWLPCAIQRIWLCVSSVIWRGTATTDASKFGIYTLILMASKPDTTKRTLNLWGVHSVVSRVI